MDSIAYDETNKVLGLKVDGADTVIPFKKGGLSKHETGSFTTVSSQANVTLTNIQKIRMLKVTYSTYISLLIKPDDNTSYTETMNIKSQYPSLGTSLTGDNSFHFQWNNSNITWTYEAWGE